MRIEDFTVLLEGVPQGEIDVIVSESLREVQANPDSYYHLFRLANLYWRLHDWPKTIEFAKKVVALDPRSFHALKMLVQGYAELNHHDACYENAKKLLSTPPTNWTKAKDFPWYLLSLTIFSKPRARLRWWREHSQLEARSDNGMLSFATAFIAWYEDPSREAQPNYSLQGTRDEAARP